MRPDWLREGLARTLPDACDQLVRDSWAATRKTAERRLHEWGLLPDSLSELALQDEQGQPANPVLLKAAMAQARRHRHRAVFVQWHLVDVDWGVLHANDARGGRYWVAVDGAVPSHQALVQGLQSLRELIANDLQVFAHGQLATWLEPWPLHLEGIVACAGLYPARLDSQTLHHLTQWSAGPDATALRPSPRHAPNSHLGWLEEEGIRVIREAVAESERAVMLYSIGKDSSVMLHLARKAFYPAPPPFSLLHVDTRWKFREMYLMRDAMARLSGMDLKVHVNPVALQMDINPFDHGSSLHTQITKTDGLKQALDAHRYDMVLGGARRDEEKSRAKERIFSFRNAAHQWDPKGQRPELWQLFNTRLGEGESMRVFPLSNWTELDVWQYILQEDIPVVPLYFAKRRPVVERNGTLLVVDDERFRLLPGETVQNKRVRFRTLGCYPLSGALESEAQNVQDIVQELMQSRWSERQGRMIDHDASASMELKKQEGYF